DNKLGTVSHFNQIGEMYLNRETPDAASSPITASSTSDIRTVTFGAAPGDTVTQGALASAPDAVYSLSSNPYLSDGTTSETTLGWTLQKFDQAGRVTDVYYYRGATKPFPFGGNTSFTGHEINAYSGKKTTFHDARDPQNNTIIKTTTIDALGRLTSVS